MSDGEDITQKFFELCGGLNVGEMVFDGATHVQVINAVELMDPKVDYGMNSNAQNDTFTDLLKAGYFGRVDDPEVLAIIDASFACLAAYTNGSPLGTTVQTNLTFVTPRLPFNPVLHYLTAAFSHIVPLVRAIIMTAKAHSHEDFHEITHWHQTDIQSMAEIDILFQKNLHMLVGSPKLKNETQRIWNALRTRLDWLRTFLQLCYFLLPPHQQFADELDSAPFKPNLPEAYSRACRLVEVSRSFASTVHLGKKNMDSTGEWHKNEGDFSWLRAFNPTYMKRLMDETYPQSTSIPSRVEGLFYIEKLSRRLEQAILLTKKESHCVVDLFTQLSQNGTCALFRSIQLNYIRGPRENASIFGRWTPREAVLDSVLGQTRIFCLSNECFARAPAKFQLARTNFLDKFAKHVETMFAAMGANPSKQRNNLLHLAIAMWEDRKFATELDKEIFDLLNIDILPRSVAGWVEWFVTIVMERYFELTLLFRIPHEEEFPSYFWVFADRIQETLASYSKTGYTMLTAAFDQKMPAQCAPRFLIQNAHVNHASDYFHTAACKMSLCRGVFFASLALLKIGSLKINTTDMTSVEHTFGIRMASMRELPMFLDYESYLLLSCQNGFLQLEAKELWEEAKRWFTAAKEFSAVLSPGPLTEDGIRDLKLVCSKNFVVVNLILENCGRTPCWEFDDGDVFPSLALR